MRFVRITVLVIFSCLIVFLAHPAGGRASAAQVELIWNHNPEPLVAGYKVHYGTSSKDYSESIDVGYVDYHRVYDLDGQDTHYFAITAYDDDGVESGFSEEVTALGPDPVDGNVYGSSGGSSHGGGGCVMNPHSPIGYEWLLLAIVPLLFRFRSE